MVFVCIFRRREWQGFGMIERVTWKASFHLPQRGCRFQADSRFRNPFFADATYVVLYHNSANAFADEWLSTN